MGKAYSVDLPLRVFDSLAAGNSGRTAARVSAVRRSPADWLTRRRTRIAHDPHHLVSLDDTSGKVTRTRRCGRAPVGEFFVRPCPVRALADPVRG